MKKLYESDNEANLRDKIIGLGEFSVRKSYYPELQNKVEELEKNNSRLKALIDSFALNFFPLYARY